MKYLNYFFITLLIFGTLSCSSDDDSNEPASVVGEWTITDGQIEPSTFNVEIGGMTIPVEISGSFVNIDANNRINFHEDNTFSSFTGNIAIELNMVVMGTPQTESFEASDMFGQGSWEQNGAELKIHNDNGSTISYTIVSNDGTNILLKSNVKDMILESGPNPILESMDIIINISLSKV